MPLHPCMGANLSLSLHGGATSPSPFKEVQPLPLFQVGPTSPFKEGQPLPLHPLHGGQPLPLHSLHGDSLSLYIPCVGVNLSLSLHGGAISPLHLRRCNLCLPFKEGQHFPLPSRRGILCLSIPCIGANLSLSILARGTTFPSPSLALGTTSPFLFKEKQLFPLPSFLAWEATTPSPSSYDLGITSPTPLFLVWGQPLPLLHPL